MVELHWTWGLEPILGRLFVLNRGPQSNRPETTPRPAIEHNFRRVRHRCRNMRLIAAEDPKGLLDWVESGLEDQHSARISTDSIDGHATPMNGNARLSVFVSGALNSLLRHGKYMV